MGNHISREFVQLLPDDRFYATGSRAALNATLPPDDPAAATEWSYMTADGSDDGAFVNAEPE